MATSVVPITPALPLEPRDVLTQHIPAIRRIVRSVARRHRLNDTAAEELESSVWVRLMEHDFRAIRQYKAQASFHTFLTVVVNRLALDVQSAEWGRWRPSRRARHLGEAGTLFETLVFRDGYSRDEALSQLEAAGHGVPSDAVEALAEKPRSMPRRYLPLEAVANRLATDDHPAAGLIEIESRRRAAQIGRILAHALQGLTISERVLLSMRYDIGLTVATIARLFSEDQKALYRKLTILHRELRQRIVRAGVRPAEIRELVGRSDVKWPNLIDLMSSPASMDAQTAA